jgi:hypothetical protein
VHNVFAPGKTQILERAPITDLMASEKQNRIDGCVGERITRTG